MKSRLLFKIRAYSSAMRIVAVSVVLLTVLSAFQVNAQVPSISSVDLLIAPAGRKIAITGSNFGSSTTNTTVFFGAAKGSVQSVAPQLIEVKVPAGATYENITVTNTTTGLIAASPSPFLFSYGGQNPFSVSNLSTQIDLNAESGLYDHCLCDFDGDGKTDMASANDNSTFVSLFRNTSVTGALSFVKSQLSMGVRSFHVRCGDLNGDGKPELIASEGGDGTRIFIFRNNSTTGSLSFTVQTISVTNKKPKQLEIADLDLDGKPELIATDQKNGAVIVLLNNSSVSSISFSSPQFFSIPGAASTDGISVDDLDNDQLPEIIVDQFLAANSNLFIIKNESTPGTLHLDKVTTITVPGTLVNIKAGDLDGDNKPDIAASQLLGSSLSIFLNQSTPTEIKFGPAVNITTDERPWGLDFGDLDGDGKTDIVTASITKKTFTILNNKSTTGSLLFDRLTVNTTFINRHIRLGDLDGDGKPDVSFTSIDDNNLGIPASKVSVMRNSACMTPVVTPDDPITICTGFPLRLFATESAGATFDWKKDGSSVSSGTNPFFDPTVSGQYSVTVTAEGGSCVKTSNAVDVTVIAGGAVSTPVLTSNAPTCIGSTLNLTVASTGATGFEWRGPDGFTATGASPSRSNFQLAHAGRYEVDVKVGTCVAQQASIVVEAINLPTFRVAFTGSDVVCAGGSKNLSVSPTVSGYTYQWFEKTSGLITGQTSTTFVANSTGEYYFEAQPTLFPTCNPAVSTSASIKIVTLPVVNFTLPTEACRGSSVSFTNQSTSDASVTAINSWDFGDGQTSTDQNPTHTFATAQDFNVKLTVAYAGNTCPMSLTKTIKIIAPPTVNIISDGNDFDICEEEKKVLKVDATFSSYTWSTGATTPTIEINEAGTYQVTVTNALGCQSNDSQEVELLEKPDLTLTATPPQISLGQSSQLSVTGLTTFLWQPGNTLSDSTISSPTATPKLTTLYTVTGIGSNGCTTSDTLRVVVKQENIGDLLKPSNFFSPNSDATNNFWQVENITLFPQCGVVIFDEKGVSVFEANPYKNDWDGTSNGKPLPNGVYYYVIRCDGDTGKPKSGSITLLR